jgi:hypothetical protein
MSEKVETSSLADPAATEPAGGSVLEPYEPPAGGLGALQSTALALREQCIALKGSGILPSMNQPDGFGGPDCACPPIVP